MRFGRRFVVSVPQDSHSVAANRVEQSQGVLAAAGFRDIVVSPDQARAIRGRLWHGFSISVDPRRFRHAIDITDRAVTYTIDSRFPIFFSSADADVLRAEARSFLATLSGTPVDEDELTQALARQRATDKKFAIKFLLFCLLFGIALVFILPV